MSFFGFLRENARWLAGGFLLVFFSAFGQTYFIALSGGHIRTEYGLSNGQFGFIYMLATLASALTLTQLGQIVDRYSVRKVTLLTVPFLALACISMAFSSSVIVLVVTIYFLRLFGQGMMTQNAFTAMGRWFSAQRGRAVSIVTLGHNGGEAILPFTFVAVSALVGWRNSWLIAAFILALVALPAIAALMAVERKPRATDPAERKTAARDWTRGEVLRDPVFYLLLLGVLAPPFIGTTIAFHQVYLVELRGWQLEVFASAFAVSALMTVIFALLSGYLIDRFSAVRVLPAFLLPMALACAVLAYFDQQWSVFVFMTLFGASNGFSSTLVGALWPEVYGIRHLGAVRSVVVAIMVFATAVGPGITGYLIDLGVSYPWQIAAMALYCLGATVLMIITSRKLTTRSLQSIEASVTSAT